MNPFRITSLLCLIAITSLALLGCSTNSKQRIQIDSGDASVTLLEFARQAQVEIIFDAQSVSGVQTHSIDGKHPPSEALSLMTSDTPLVVNRDKSSGAFAVTRKT